MNKIKIILFSITIFAIAFAQPTKTIPEKLDKKKSDIKSSKTIFSNTESSEEYLKVLDRALQLLKTNYVDSLNESEMVISAIKGLMKNLDPYTKLLMDQAKAGYDDLRKGKFGGIGLYIGMRRDTLTVLGTIENSPAYSEGIQIGDNILMIDSTYTKDLTIKECTSLMRGELDSLVTLTIYRSATKEKIEFHQPNGSVAYAENFSFNQSELSILTEQYKY